MVLLKLEKAIIEFLIKKGRWGSNYFPLQTLVRWFSYKVEKDGKEVLRAIKKLVKKEILLIHKGGKTISLNPHKFKEIAKIIEG